MHSPHETAPATLQPEQPIPPPLPSAPPYPTPPGPQPGAPYEPTRPNDEVHMGYPAPDMRPTTTFRAPEPTQWSTGLCEWYSNMPNCCITCFCPCITFGQFSEIVDRGSSSCPINGLIYAVLLTVFGCACMYSYVYRVRLRQQFNLKGSHCEDCCIHTWCEVCALAQEYRELKIRGFDLHTGWQANVENQTAGAMMMAPPPMQTGMRR